MLTWLPLYLFNAQGFRIAQMAFIAAEIYALQAISTRHWLDL